MPDHHQEKLWNSYFITILVINIFTSMGFSIVMPIVAKYAISLGATVAFAGVIAGFFSITALIGRPFSGVIADKFNKKYVMLFATVMLAVSTLGYGISTSTSMLLFFRILHGLAFSISGTASMSLGTAFIPHDRLGEGIGFLGIGFILSRAVGPNIGIVLLENYGYTSVFIAGFAIVALSAVMMLFIKYTHEKKESSKATGKKFKLKLSDMIAKEILMITVVVGTISVMNGLISSFLVNLSDEKGIVGIGIYFTVNAVVLLLIRPFSGKLIDKKRLAFIAYPAFILAIIAALLIGFSTSLWTILLAAVLYAIGQGASQPAFQATCIKKLGRNRVGVATSTYYIGADIGNGLGPMIGGVIAGSFGFSSVYFFGAIILLAGMALFFIYDKKEKHDAQDRD